MSKRQAILREATSNKRLDEASPDYCYEILEEKDIMNLKEAKEITGGLSSPSKMPGYAYNLPAWRCITGVKLQAVPGSVCAGCYAMKGRYRFRNVKEALERRQQSLVHPQWVQAMTWCWSRITARRSPSSGGMTLGTCRGLIIS